MDFFEHRPHLGSCLSYSFDDEFDIARKTDILCGQINDVICFFNKRDFFTKLCLLESYCASLFGSMLWDLSRARIECLCDAWRKGCKRVWHMSFDAHSTLLPIICCELPLLDTLCS
jgi:hypothetical protein